MSSLGRLSMVLTVLGVLTVVACGPEAPQNREGQIPPQAHHAVHSAALRSLMTEMGREVRQRWPQEIAQLKAQQNASQRQNDIVATADRLANAAHAIPESVPESELTGSDREAFMRLVAQLESNARSLARKAGERDSAGVDTALSQLRGTCNACHSQFREITGPLRWGS